MLARAPQAQRWDVACNTVLPHQTVGSYQLFSGILFLEKKKKIQTMTSAQIIYHSLHIKFIIYCQNAVWANKITN